MSDGMSISFGSSRDPLTAAAARMTRFDTVRKHGLDPDQVSDFVDHVCETISALSRAREECASRAALLDSEVAQLREELATLTRQRDTASERSLTLAHEVKDLRDRLARSPGEAAAEVLMLAHEAAASTAERAAETAAVTAERIIADAESEADRRRLLVTTELAGRVARVEYLTRVETELCEKLSTVADEVRSQLDRLPGLGLDALNVIETVDASVARAESSGALDQVVTDLEPADLVYDSALEESSPEDISSFPSSAAAEDTFFEVSVAGGVSSSSASGDLMVPIQQSAEEPYARIAMHLPEGDASDMALERSAES